jgi:diguanylate cyclase (GGDEF)-like protein
MIMVAMAMAPLFALAAWAAVEQRELAAERERVNVQRWVRLLADGHELLVRDARQLLRVLARVPALRAAEPEACHALFSDLLARYPQYVTLGLARADGELIASAAREGGEARAWIRERILRRAAETGTLMIGEPRLSGEVPLPTVFLADTVPSRLGRAIVFASVELAWVDSEFAATRLPRGATVTVWDGSGVILGRHPRPQHWRGVVASDSALFRSVRASGSAGSVEVRGLDGVRRIYGFAALDPQDRDRSAVLALGVPLDVAFAETRSLERKSLFALVAMTLLALAVGWFGGDRLVVRLFGQAIEAANRDSLTGLLSRRRVLVLGRSELQRAQRFGHDLAALMVDVDRFKNVNDRYGHSVGDQVLREVAARCSAAVRGVDLVGRYGGEEFLVILPETGPAAATEAAQRLCTRVAEAPIRTREGPIDVTVSVGAAAGSGSGQLEALVEAADRALYMAKTSGRNRVVILEPAGGEAPGDR